MRLYISGPMTGLPNYNYPAFNEAAAKLRTLGHDPINPADHSNPDFTYQDYIKLDIADLLTADGLVSLPNWQHSKGAVLEHHIAEVLELPISDIEAYG
jgi:hypothetical protein